MRYEVGEYVVFRSAVTRQDELRVGKIGKVSENPETGAQKWLFLYQVDTIHPAETYERRDYDVLGKLWEPEKPALTKIGRMSRANILAEAAIITQQDRNIDYDSPERNFSAIADLWNSHFGTSFKPHEVAIAMMLVKIARTRTSPLKRDHWVDIAGYAACGGECAEEEVQVQGEAGK